MSSPTPAETSAGVAVGLHRRIPMRIRRPPAIHKKPQSPQAHVLQAIHRNPCLAASHTPRIPIQAISSHNHNLTMRPPRPAAGPLKPTHPTRLLRFHRPTPGGHVRHRFAMRRRQRRRCVGVDVRGGSTCVMVGPGARQMIGPEGQPA